MSKRPNAKRRMLTSAEIKESRLGKISRIRQCGGCQDYARHDITTCPKRKEKEKPSPVASGPLRVYRIYK